DGGDMPTQRKEELCRCVCFRRKNREVNSVGQQIALTNRDILQHPVACRFKCWVHEDHEIPESSGRMIMSLLINCLDCPLSQKGSQCRIRGSPSKTVADDYELGLNAFSSV